ncbi:MAG TPA: four helix bundle protein [Anaerolineae bacterium]|nr:four helix bundle protein [Anaerolineae bacterium]HMR67385.1 four helix bundle protein [Anaerolineae bacterium]
MGKIERFEDIQAWQKARKLNQRIYEVTNSISFRHDFALKDQIRRAAISIMLNIAEGFAPRTNQELARLLFMAHGSVTEVQSALYIAKDQAYLSEQDFDTLYQVADELSRLISGFIKCLRGTE